MLDSSEFAAGKNKVDKGLKDTGRLLQMAKALWDMKPSSVRKAGTVHCGLIWRKAWPSCSPVRRSTGTVVCETPFSARKMRARRGLGAVAQSYKVIMARCPFSV